MQVGLRRTAWPLASRLFGAANYRCAGSWATVDPSALSGSKPGKAENCGKHADASFLFEALRRTVRDSTQQQLVMQGDAIAATTVEADTQHRVLL